MKKVKRRYLSIPIIVLIVLGYIGIQIVTNPSNNVQLTDYEVVTAESGKRMFRGTIKNQAGGPASNIYMTISFMNQDKMIEQTSVSTTKTLTRDQSWEFELSMPSGEVDSFRIENISWQDDARDRSYSFDQVRSEQIRAE